MSEERPPFGTWRRTYWAVIFYLILLIALFTAFTVRWNR
jgi:hypothetical protein